MRLSSLLVLAPLLLLLEENAARARLDFSGLPLLPLPANHPCRLPDKGFAAFYEKGGVTIRTHLLAEGRAVVRSVAEIPAPPERVARFMADVGAWSTWVKRLRRSERLPGEPPAFHLFYDAPWPFSDRDYALAPAFDRDEDGNPLVWWESAADRLPPAERSVVRVHEIRGGLVFRPGSLPDTTRVVYTDLAVLGGRLPAWAVRESYRRGPVGILGALRRVFARNPLG